MGFGKKLRRAAHKATKSIRKVNQAAYSPILKNPVADKLRLNQTVKRIGFLGARYVAQPALATVGGAAGFIAGGPAGAAGGAAAGSLAGKAIRQKIGTKGRHYSARDGAIAFAVGGIAGYAGGSIASGLSNGITLSSVGGALAAGKTALDRGRMAKGFADKFYGSGDAGLPATDGSNAGAPESGADWFGGRPDTGAGSSMLPIALVAVALLLLVR